MRYCASTFKMQSKLGAPKYTLTKNNKTRHLTIYLRIQQSYQLLIAQCQESDYCRAGRSNKSFEEFS